VEDDVKRIYSDEHRADIIQWKTVKSVRAFKNLKKTSNLRATKQSQQTLQFHQNLKLNGNQPLTIHDNDGSKGNTGDGK